jgi:hypothetical protein
VILFLIGSPYILHKNEKLGSLHELVAIKNLSKPCPGSKFKSIFQDLISSSRTPPSSETMTDITDNDSNQKTLFDSWRLTKHFNSILKLSSQLPTQLIRIENLLFSLTNKGWLLFSNLFCDSHETSMWLIR